MACTKFKQEGMTDQLQIYNLVMADSSRVLKVHPSDTIQNMKTN